MSPNLCRAIATRRVLRFEYDGGLRTIEPHAHGFAADGAELLSGYQTFGVSASGDLPGWRTFRLDQIATLRVTDDPFTPRPDFDRARPGFSQLHCSV